MNNFKAHFGGKITEDDTQRYAQSENWKDGVFQNFELTKMDMSFWKIPSMIYKPIAKLLIIYYLFLNCNSLFKQK